MFKHLYEKSTADTYGRFDVEIISGKGATCIDAGGKKYIDFTSGIGVNSLGFCDPDWSAAVAGQAGKLNHTSNLYYTSPGGELCAKLTSLTGYSKVFLCNSGAEATEGAIKAVRKYSHDKYGENRHTILTLKNSFHGRTLTALTATGQENLQAGFAPLTPGFKYIPANDINALQNELNSTDENGVCRTNTVCSVMIEFIQGEGGVIPLDKDYIKQLFELCAQKDVLVIADEVQTGIGRTGKFLCAEHYNVNADITTLAKGLGGGLPIGAILFNEKTAAILGRGSHGSTYGGNPIVCAGANVVLQKVSDPGFLVNVNRAGDYLQSKLKTHCDVSGAGLMLGLELKNKKAADVALQTTKSGLLTLIAKNKLRLLPPLNISEQELEAGLEILLEVLNSPSL
ncbi:MAG: acetylornithine/succinylornithine family transaminase [Oscillospiraceae bacterium]|nr:acetylornithine/succinylornithine family transaminase [Oscillospiraceae bacterium]